MTPAGEEIELKFGVPPEREAALRRALRDGAARTERLRALYFDTADERLGRGGAAIRLRREGRRWVQTLKVSTGDALRRLEHEVPVASPPDGGEPALDLARHVGTPAGEAFARLVGDAPPVLVERFRTDVQRTVREVRVRGARIELALDVGVVAAGDRTEPLRELELELKGGALEGLLAVAGRWQRAHGLWLSTETKAARGARLVRGEAPAAVQAAAIDVGRHADAATFWRAALRSSLDQAVANLAALAEGAAAPELVHQARVGIRRVRTVLRMVADAAPGGVDPAWNAALRTALSALGAHRDAQVVLPAVRQALPSAGVPLFDDPVPADALPPLVAVARDAALQQALLALLALAVRPAERAWPSLATRSARADLAARFDALHARLVRDARRYASLDAERRHRVRKRVKRLRDVGELAAAVFGSKRVARYLAHWRAAQDALGAANDARVAADAWRRRAEGGEAGAWYAVGWLAAREDAHVDACRRALRDAVRARPFWC